MTANVAHPADSLPPATHPFFAALTDEEWEAVLAEVKRRNVLLRGLVAEMKSS